MKCNKEDLIYKSDVLRMINTEHNSWGSCAVEFEMIGLKGRIRRLEPISEQEIRAKAIDEFQKEIKDWQIDIQDNEYDADKFDFVFERIYEIAEQLKGARE